MKLLITLIFLFAGGNAFAMCTGKSVRQTEVAIFHSLTDATIFAETKRGNVYASEDGQTFTVLYPVTTIVTNMLDDCGVE